MRFSKNICETGGNALNDYIAAHGTTEEVFANLDTENSHRAETVSEFLKKVSESKAKYETVFDGFDECNPDTGGRVFVKSNADCAAIYLDTRDEFDNALKFLKNVDAFALAAENNPEGSGVVLTLDWRVEGVRF